jgi:hypothetical protein
MLLMTKENTMLKTFKRKLFTLFVLIAALITVASPPVGSCKGVFCMDAPLEAGCDITERWCCDEMNHCECSR